MIKNRRELKNLATQWMGHAMNDLREQLLSFIEQNGTNEVELANALTVPVEEIESILNGDSDIALSTFAKLLISTENVIEIKPLAVMKEQFGGHMPQMPPRGHMPMDDGCIPSRPMGIPTPLNGRMPQMPPMGEGFPMPPIGDEMPQRFGGMPGMGLKKPKQATPNRLPNGRFAPKNTQQRSGMQRVRLEDLELDELGRNELCDIIAQNHWDSEIDLNTTRRGDLIDFLTYKMTQHEMPKMETNRHTVAVEEPQVQETEKDKIARLLAEEVERNPHLKELVKKYL